MTPQYAPVAPLAGLEALAKADQLGKYQLLIAPVILKNSWAYSEFFWEKHTGQTVIVDNGVIELGYSLDAGQLAKAALTVGATAVVLPDTIDDAKFTMKQVRFNMREYRKHDNATKTIGVVQGVTFEECMECAASHVEAGVDWLAVPRGLTKNLGSRVELVQALATEHGLPIHVLGFSDWILDDIRAAASHRLVMGIDAATPMWYPRFLPPLAPVDPEVSRAMGKRPEGFWLTATPDAAPANVLTVRRWLSDALAARTAREGLAGRTAPQPRDSSS